MNVKDVAFKYPEQTKELAKNPGAIFKGRRIVFLIKRTCRRCYHKLLEQPDVLAVDKSVLCENCKRLYEKIVEE